MVIDTEVIVLIFIGLLYGIGRQMSNNLMVSSRRRPWTLVRRDVSFSSFFFFGPMSDLGQELPRFPQIPENSKGGMIDTSLKKSRLFCSLKNLRDCVTKYFINLKSKVAHLYCIITLELMNIKTFRTEV